MTGMENILRDIVREIEDTLGRTGIMYRIFSRCKSQESIEKKINTKFNEYTQSGKKMQDLLALRITLYFNDDVKILHQYLKSLRNYDNESVTDVGTERFCPQCLNLVMRIPDALKEDMRIAIKGIPHSELIDETYEIQLRTVLSEGWHEVEHDLRYKCKDDWGELLEDSRLLNGVYATLENSDWAMLSIFDNVAYSHYKKNQWTPMIRNKMRLRFKDNYLSEEVSQYLTNNINIAKKIFRADRDQAILHMLKNKILIPPTFDNIVHILNHMEEIDEGLIQYESEAIKSDLELLKQERN